MTQNVFRFLWLIDIPAACILAVLLRRFVFMLVFVKGTSMLDTLQNGELMLVRRYGRKSIPRRGDIVISTFPSRKQLFVKRLVALPGETFSMEDDTVFIDGIPITETYPHRRCLRRTASVTLEDDQYYLLGDNRSASHDSRSMGPVHRRDLKGRCVCVLFPLNRIRRLR